MQKLYSGSLYYFVSVGDLSFSEELCFDFHFVIQMARMEDILNLPVQDPPFAEFSSAHIKWVKVEGGRQGGDDIALIPFARVDDFVKGESSNAECPASFRVESKRKRPEGSVSKPRVDGYLEYTLYVVSVGLSFFFQIEMLYHLSSLIII